MTYFVNIANADSIGVSRRLVMSSLTNSGQCSRKLCIAERAPARPSRVTCHVNASPRAFSLSSSLLERGNEFLQRSSILGNSPFTTAVPGEFFEQLSFTLMHSKKLFNFKHVNYLPKVIIAPIRSHPAWVLFKDSRLFWLALLKSSSAVLNMICI